jgi:Fe-S-cluster-containing hydrogenase component 2
VQACPENAIGLDYQIDMNLCNASRACVKVCQSAGAIDFNRVPHETSEKFDLILDLRQAGATGPQFLQHAPPQGYFKWDGRDLATLIKLRDMVGEFEKPKFFAYKQKLCAHSRNEMVGCNACVDICSAEAISSDKSRQQIKVNPNLCVGCGACTTVCPTGALTYAYPKAQEQGSKIKTLLSTYHAAGGKDAVLMLHSQEAGLKVVEELGRAAQLKLAKGMPANVILAHRQFGFGSLANGSGLWCAPSIGALHKRRSTAILGRAGGANGRGPELVGGLGLRRCSLPNCACQKWHGLRS